MRNWRIGVQVAALLILLMLASCFHADSQASDGLRLRVEPRLVTTSGIIHIYVASIPKGYTAVVARLEGPITTGYVTLTPGSVAAIDLSLYDAKPGLYYVAVYDAPGGRLLARIPVLVVKPVILVSPPKPTIGEEFSITVAIQPAGYEYHLTLHVDSMTFEVKPGQRISLKLDKRGPYKVCLDVEALVEGERFYTPNVTCKTLVLNLPPSVSFDIRVTGNYLVLVTDSVDPDGIVTLVKYTCVIDNRTYTGYVSPGFARTVLSTVNEVRELYMSGYKTLQCTVEAVDDAGGVTIRTKSFNLTTILGIATGKPSKASSGRETGAQTPTRTATRTVTTTPTTPAQAGGPRLPLPHTLMLLVVVGAVAAGGASAVIILRRRSRRAPTAKAAEARAPETGEVDLTSIIVRLDRIEQRLEELHARVGELQGEVDELRRRVRRLERSGEKQGR